MKFSSFKIICLSLVISLMGLLMIPQLTIQLNPSPKINSIVVSYSYPNASSYIVEKQVTAILEAGFSTIAGVKKIVSKSSKNGGYIDIEFSHYSSLESKRFEIATIIRQLYNKLPHGVRYPEININSENEDQQEKAFMTFDVSGSSTTSEIQGYINNNIVSQLNTIPGINNILVYGANPLEWVITYEKTKCHYLDISKNDIIRAIKENFDVTDFGVLNSNNHTVHFSLSKKDSLNWNIPIKTTNNKIIYLRDVATITEKQEEAQSYFRVNGKNTVGISIYPKKNTNTIKLAQQINKKFDKLKIKLPKDLYAEKSYDSTDFLQSELNNIYFRCTFAFTLLLLFILIVTRSFKFLSIILISVIVNICVAFVFYFLLNIEIQLFSLAGITISLGLVFDNFIVMIDYCRKKDDTNIIIPILASTLTTVGALSTIYFINESYRNNLIDFAQVIIINLTVSVAVAFFLIPALIEKMNLKKSVILDNKNINSKISEKYKYLILFLLKYKKLVVITIILLFGIPFYKLPHRLETNNSTLEKVYNNTIGNYWFSENIRPYIDKYLGGSMRLFSIYVFENAEYRSNQETKLCISASMNADATIHQLNDAFLELEKYLSTFPEIKKTITQINSTDYGIIEISFKSEFVNTSFPFVLKSKLTRRALNLGGIEWEIYGIGNGFGNKNFETDPVNIKIRASGYNYDLLNKFAENFKKKISTHPRIQNIVVKDYSNFYNPKKVYQQSFSLNKETMAIYKTSPLDVFAYLNENTLTKYSTLDINVNQNMESVRIQSKESTEQDIWNITNTPILNSNLNSVSLKKFSEIKKVRTDENIYKQNQEYIRLIELQYTGSEKLGMEYINRNITTFNNKIPLGFKFANDNNWTMSDKKANFVFIIGIIFIMLFFICSILFNSFSRPFAIISIVPISFIGVFLTFYCFDFKLDQGGLASFILLCGVTVNASIFIMNEFILIRKVNSILPINAFIMAYLKKIKIILLTVFSTILGLIPFLINTKDQVFWFSFSVGSIGGLIFSLIGITFFLPLFCIKKE